MDVELTYTFIVSAASFNQDEKLRQIISPYYRAGSLNQPEFDEMCLMIKKGKYNLRFEGYYDNREQSVLKVSISDGKRYRIGELAFHVEVDIDNVEYYCKNTFK